MATVMYVLAGALCDADGRILLAERPAGKQLAGMWEFPGGKREPGETPLAALARELDEELGVAVIDAAPLVRVPWHYAGHELLLDAWRVTRWRHEPAPREGQRIAWYQPRQVDPKQLAPADRIILRAVCGA